MAAVSLCPDAQMLQRFLLGQNSADEADTLEQHLEQCERCLSVLHTLAGRDSVVEAIRSQSGAEADNPAIRGLAERLKQLRPVDEATTRTQAHTSEAATLPPRTQADAPEPQGHGASSEEIYDFLAPGQEPGELGRLGQYQVRKVLGSGGMGVVFQAFDPHLERLVALKAMLPSMAASASAKQRFLREAKAAAAIKHDHIVTIYQVGEDRGAPFLAMEFLEGESLDERLKREARLPVPEVLRIGREMAVGLAAAHQRGLIHRDIKPGNVWLEERGAPSAERAAQAGGPSALNAPRPTRVKILDFGLARAVADQAHLTQAGAIIGTPAFMAPEQVGGEAVDARCDLFSLGCVLYRMATGELPFKGKDTISTLVAVANEKPRPPQQLNPQLPAALCTLIERLLDKKPDERPPSAAAVVDAIEAIERTDVSAAPAQQPLAKRRLPRRVVAAAVLLALLGVAGYLFGPVVVRYAANEGEVVIVIDDPQVQAVVDQTGVTIRDRAKQREYKVQPGRHDLKTGEYVLEVTEVGGDVRLFTKEFTISRGGKTSVKVTFDPKVRVDESAANAVFTNSLGMEFVLVPRGKSWLGGGGGNRGPKVVDIPCDFYLGRYEVTQEEWEKVTGLNPSRFQGVKGVKWQDLKRFPVEEVSWAEAQNFAARVSSKTKEAGWVYRLPTQVEWEYACRGGPMDEPFYSTFDYYLQKPSNLLLPSEANFDHPKALKRTCKVGSYPPNRLGLYDMHGNVLEWCLDEIKDDKGAWRVGRGGCWARDASECRAPAWLAIPLPNRHDDVGLRLARVPVGAGVKWRRQGDTGPAALATAEFSEVLPTAPNCLAVSPKGRLVAVGGGILAGGKDAMLSLWDLQRRQVSYRLDGHPDNLWAVAFSPDGRLVASASQGEIRPEFVQKPRGVIHPRLHLWNAQTGGKIRELPGHTSTISSVVFTPEGRIVSGAWDNTIRLWTTAGEPIKTIDVKHPVLSLAVFPGGERCLFGSVDDKLRVIDMVTGKALDEFAGANRVESLALSSDGRKAFSCGHDGTVGVLDFTTRQERRFLGHVGPVLTLALSSDNRRLLSGGDDKVIRLWDVETGARIASLEGHTARVRSVIFLPGDRRALSGGWDSTLRLWSLPDAVSPAPPAKKDK